MLFMANAAPDAADVGEGDRQEPKKEHNGTDGWRSKRK
jgi:hypothetical protein